MGTTGYNDKIMFSHSLSYYVLVATRAAIAAGTFLVRYAGKPGRVKTKRSAIDLVTEIDRASEDKIRKQLLQATPEFGFLGEEHGVLDENAEYRWIIDPIDGTNNFVHGFPFFGVSIGLEHQGRILVGVIYDPVRQELFWAARGKGAWLNKKRIHVSPARTLAKSLVATGFSTHFLSQDQPYLGWFQELQRCSHGVRRIGSTVLCLAAVAAGRLEGFYERDLWPWDIAAGIVLVEEAGGKVSNLKGTVPVLTEGRLVATNGRIHQQLLQALARSGKMD